MIVVDIVFSQMNADICFYNTRVLITFILLMLNMDYMTMMHLLSCKYIHQSLTEKYNGVRFIIIYTRKTDQTTNCFNKHDIVYVLTDP